MKFLKAILSPWTWRMAWRDSRASRRKLLLFSSSIVIGIAALVAISSFSDNLRSTIDQQAKALLGADLVLASRDPFTPEQEEVFKKIGGEQAREVVFSSMVLFPKTGGTRLVQVRALGKGFPFYGQFETRPASAFGDFQSGGALMEETLLYQFNASVGDNAKIGDLILPIQGAILKIPGENAVFSTIAPRVYIPLAQLDETKLLRDDSFARFKIFFKLPVMTDVEAMVRRLRPKLDKLRLGVDTVEERKADLGNAVQNVNQFLSLGGFIALMLGAIGIASAIHVHVQQKTPSVAVLRCLGCTISQTFAIYLLQAIALGVIGAVFGASLGILIQYSLPRVAADFLPFRMVVYVAWPAVLRAMAAGFAVCLIFALFPLISLRRVSPLAVLRSFYESRPAFRDPMQWTVTIILAIGILLLAKASTVRWSHAIGFTAGLAGAFLALAISAEIIRATARGVISPAWPYIWRQGMANLYRPHNRTLLLLLSLGLGAFLVLTLYRTHQLLSGGLLLQDRENQPNTALFDIQADQTDGVKQILQNQKLPVLADVPLVTMRLASVKGVPVRQLLRDRGRSIPRWALRREYRSTYRNTLDSSEHLVKGRWPATAGSTNVIPVSIEEGIARDLKVDLGDQIVFDVQGVLFTNEVASIRRVDWKRIQPNFFMVFPTGILEQAPGFHIVTTRVTNRVDSAAMQRRVVEKFPNVSVIDLTLVLDTIDAVLTKVSFVVRFMASFTVITGIVVLIASVLTGRYQRIQESILLRTLGASRQQVQRILLIEYLLLGLLSALTAVLLAEAGAWGLAKFLFKVPFHPAFLPALIATVLVVAVTILTGLLANRGVLNSPPLEVLRSSG